MKGKNKTFITLGNSTGQYVANLGWKPVNKAVILKCKMYTTV